MIMSKDTAVWDRRATPTGVDALGVPASGSASGFPRSGVRGNYQEASRGAKVTVGGVEVSVEASFFSDQFMDGLVGDWVTVKGRTLYVVRVGARSAPGSSARGFVRYWLSASVPGVSQPAG